MNQQRTGKANNLVRDTSISCLADNTPEGKRKKRKIEAEGLISNSKKIRRYRSKAMKLYLYPEKQDGIDSELIDLT